jgi:hypothetical protein
VKPKVAKTGEPSKPDQTIVTSRHDIALIMRELADEGAFTPTDTVPRASYSLAEFGYAHGICDSTVRKLVRAGMPHMKIGAQIRIEPGPALEWLRQHGARIAERESEVA